MFQKLKALLIILLFGYLGYLELKRSGPSNDHQIAMEEIHNRLDEIQSELFSDLSKEYSSQDAQIRSLWNTAETKYKKGMIQELEAHKVATLLKRLNAISEEKKIFAARYQQFTSKNTGPFSAAPICVWNRRNAKTREVMLQWKIKVDNYRPSINEAIAQLAL